jgi:hypothetical protein
LPGLSILSPEFLYFEKRSARLAAGISSSPWAVSSSPFYSLYSRARAFRRPMGVPDMVPSWMPAHLFWAYFVGCALFAADTSLTVRKFVRLSSTLLGLMFYLFVCMMPIPNALADPKNRFAWAYALRDLSFAGGAWALAGLHSRASSPQQSKWIILLGRIVIAIAAIFFAVEFFLHPEFAPGFPLKRSRHRRFHSTAYGDTSQERSYWPLESAWL